MINYLLLTYRELVAFGREFVPNTIKLIATANTRYANKYDNAPGNLVSIIGFIIIHIQKYTPDVIRSAYLFIDLFSLIICATEKTKEVISEPKNSKVMPPQKFIPSTFIDNDCEPIKETITPYSTGKIVEERAPPINIMAARFINSKLTTFSIFLFQYI